MVLVYKCNPVAFGSRVIYYTKTILNRILTTTKQLLKLFWIDQKFGGAESLSNGFGKCRSTYLSCIVTPIVYQVLSLCSHGVQRRKRLCTCLYIAVLQCIMGIPSENTTFPQTPDVGRKKNPERPVFI